MKPSERINQNIIGYQGSPLLIDVYSKSIIDYLDEEYEKMNIPSIKESPLYPAPELTHPVAKMAYRMVRLLGRGDRYLSSEVALQEINQAALVILNQAGEREAWIFKKLAMVFTIGRPSPKLLPSSSV